MLWQTATQRLQTAENGLVWYQQMLPSTSSNHPVISGIVGKGTTLQRSEALVRQQQAALEQAQGEWMEAAEAVAQRVQGRQQAAAAIVESCRSVGSASFRMPTGIILRTT